MKRIFSFLLVFAALVLAACSFRQSFYKRYQLPKGLDEATEQKVFRGVVQALRSQPFIDELKKRFPTVTQAKLLKTDIRYDVLKTVGTDSTRSVFVSIGVKDTSDFPEAGPLVDFFLEYAKAEAEKILAAAGAKKG